MMYWIILLILFLILHSSEELINRKKATTPKGRSQTQKTTNAAPRSPTTTAPKFECYTCSGDKCETIKRTKSTAVCKSKCCYLLSRFGDDGLYNERGCSNANDCDLQCQSQESSAYHQIRCDSCEAPLCNNATLPSKFICNECSKCNRVGKETKVVPCRDSKCCYWAEVKDAEEEESYVKRGCIPWRRCVDVTEADVCDYVTKEFHRANADGVMVRCRICQNDKDKCNDKKVEPEMKCYDCKGADCGVISDKISVVTCSSGCCYAASTFSAKGYTNFRKCSKVENVTCKNFCAHYTKTLLPKVPAEKMECDSCSTFKCNTKILKPPFKCYQCKRCNVAKGHRLVDCVSPECCYTVYKKDHKDENLYAERGCAPWSSDRPKCRRTCKNVEDTHRVSYPDGEYKECKTCDKEARSGCNDKIYEPPPQCYSCSGGEICSNVVDSTTVVICPSQCCLAVVTFGKSGINNVRKCAGANVSCTMDFCKDYKDDFLKNNPDDDFAYCRPCEDFKCNHEKLIAPFKCYECTKCNKVRETDRMVNCRMPSCCYSMYVRDTEDGIYYTKRGCMEWKAGRTCADARRVADDLHFKQFPMGDVFTKTICVDGAPSGCNNDTYDIPDIKDVTGPPSILCYDCRKNCNDVTMETNKIRCAEDKCCYRAAMSDRYEETLFAERGCIRVGRTETCDKTCEYVQRRHLENHPNGTFHVCIHCDKGDKDKCNFAEFIIPKHIIPENRQTLAIRCYNCTHCNKVVSITPNIQCRHPKCCYSAFLSDGGKGNFYSVRGCAEWKPGVPCGDDTCDLVQKHHILKHSAGLLDHCVACNEADGNECNKKTYITKKIDKTPPIICYACKGCNKVTSISGSIECPASECCYRALLQKTVEDTLAAERGCARLRPGQTCNNTCKYMEEQHYIEHPRGLMHVCIQCRENDVDKCNGKRFYSIDEFTKDRRPPGTILCYDCRNCGKVSVDTPTVECRSARCCYTAYLQDRLTQEAYAVRGCARWRRERTCVHTCKDVEADHKWVHPYGAFLKCNACNATAPDRCNRFPLYFPRTTTVASAQFTSMMCFECRNCYEVTNHTQTVECPAPNCCYTAHLKNHVEDVFYVARGCGRWDRNNRCRKTCSDVRNEHLWLNPLGQYITCFTCHEGDTDECNKNYYTPPRTTTAPPLGPPVLMCYKCRNCNKVTVDTPKVKCQYPKCCYIVLVRDSNNQSIFAVRGCVSTSEPCLEPCKQLKKEHLTVHTTGSFDYCMTCNVGESDECNRNNYNPPKHPQTTTIPAPKEIMCYKCHECNKVSNEHETVKCPQPKCCYIVLLKDANNNDYADRGCSASVDCGGTCKHLREKYNTGNSKERYMYCATCDESEGDECNRNIYHPQAERKEQLMSRKLAIMQCFICDNCMDIQMNTPKTICMNKCCYTKKVHGIYQRGCVNEGPCDSYCASSYCETCTASKCNIQKFSEISQDHSIEKRSPPHINCYVCIGCYKVLSDSPIVKCPDDCCVIVWWTEHQESTLVRMCAKLNGEPCGNYCERTLGVIRAHDPKGVVHYCEECSINRCNYIEVYRPHLVVKDQPFINCYKSKDCKCKGTATDVCMSGCCYLAVLETYGKSVTLMGCARLQPGRSCFKYCNYIRKHSWKEHRNGNIVYCRTCGSDLCNFDNTQTTTVAIETTDTLRIEDSTTFTVHTTNGTTSDKCIKHNNTTSISENDTKTTVINDIVTKTTIINNEDNKTLITNEEVSIIDDNDTNIDDTINEIDCYECINCIKIQSEMPVKCLAGCCYSARLIVDEQRIKFIRECVQIRPGRSCLTYCNHVQKEHLQEHRSGSVEYCKVCETDKCNSENLNTQIGSVTKRIVEEGFKCYTCKNCYTISRKERLINCNCKCCITLVVNENDVNVIIRKCARLKGVPCRQYCSHLKTTRKVIYCEVCNINKCNRNPVRSPEMMRPKINCYKTRNTSIITSTSPFECCDTGCCFAAILENDDGTVVRKRGCARYILGSTCQQFCLEVRKMHFATNIVGSDNFYCKTCVREKCNNQDLNTGANVAVTKQIIPLRACYSCIGCYSVNTSSVIIECPDNCCYTVVWTEYGVTTMARLCAELEGNQCANYCSYLGRRLKHSTELGILHHCSTCCTRKCNCKPVSKPHSVAKNREPKVIECYQCENCYDISNITTPTVRCETGCCYSTLKHRNDGAAQTSRQCAKIIPGRPCYKYCQHLKRIHLISNPRGSIPYCEICTTDRCNRQKPEIPETPQASTNNTKCYECIGCYAITNETWITSKPCITDCCHTIIWTEFSDTIISRSCVGPGETPCSHYCENAKRTILNNDPTGKVHNCDVCRTDNCNKLKAFKPYIGPSTQKPPTVKCYNCTGCNELIMGARTVECPGNCCYTALLLSKHNSTKSIRGCARIMPGKPCENTCAFIKKVHATANFTTKHCTYCMKDRCNHDNLDLTIAEGNVDEPSNEGNVDGPSNTGNMDRLTNKGKQDGSSNDDKTDGPANEDKADGSSAEGKMDGSVNEDNTG